MSDYTINDILKIARKNHHYTQTDFAKSVGYSDSTISKIENGKKAMTVDEFFHLMKELDCMVQITIAMPVLSPYSGRIINYKCISAGTLPDNPSNFSELESFCGKLSDSDRKKIKDCLTMLLRSIDTH